MWAGIEWVPRGEPKSRFSRRDELERGRRKRMESVRGVPGIKVLGEYSEKEERDDSRVPNIIQLLHGSFSPDLSHLHLDFRH